MVQKKLPLINSSHGSETRNIINELIKLFNGMGYTYDEALYQAKTILNEAKKTNNMNKDVQAQVNNIISEFNDEGTTNAEVVQARGGHTVLNERLNLDENKFNRDFKNRSLDKQPITNLNTSNTKAALNTFIDDDGAAQVLTKLKPLSEKHGVPFTIALIGSFIENGTGVTPEQAIELQEDLGWEIASHQYNHIRLDETNDVNILLEELKYSKEYLRSFGLRVNNMVYPFGRQNKQIKDMTSQYYNCGVGTNDGTNQTPVSTYNLRRIAFPHASANNSLQWYKDVVDNAIANKEWLIWMLHCSQSVHDSQNQQILDDLIAYMNNKNLETVTLQEGLERFGNMFSTSDEELYIAVDGKNNMVNHKFLPINQTTGLPEVDGLTKPNEFEVLKETTTSIVGTARGTMPLNANGTLTTIVGSTNDMVYQFYYPTTNRIFYRHSQNADSWREWIEISTKKDTINFKTNPQTIQPNTSIRIPVTNSAILLKDMNILNALKAFPSVLIWSYNIHGDGIMYINILNTSNNIYELPELDWEINRRT